MYICSQTRMYRITNSSDKSQTRRGLQARYDDVPDHSKLLLDSLRRTLITSPIKPQYHRGLLTENKNLNRELPDEIEEDSVLPNEVQDNTATPKKRFYHKSLYIQLPR